MDELEIADSLAEAWSKKSRHTYSQMQEEEGHI
jgi:hypothetical protein